MEMIVSSKRLDKYGEFYLLDQMVRMYPAYTHEGIFRLSVREVYTMKLLTMENAYLENQRQKTRGKIQEAKNKGKKKK